MSISPVVPSSSLPFTEVTKPSDSHRIFARRPKPWTYYGAICDFIKRLFSSFAWKRSELGLNRPPFFVTSRDEKFREVQTLLAGVPLRRVSFPLPTLERVDDIVQVAVYRVLKAHKKLVQAGLPGSCFLEETKLCVAVPGYKQEFPGRYYKEVCEDYVGRQQFAEEHQGRPARTESVFAYTEDGETVHIFTGESKGTIVNPGKHWVEIDGWEPFFVPNGYAKPLSELNDHKNIINMRQFPCLQMRSVMREKSYPGVYETHITVYNDSNGDQNPQKPTEEHIQKFQTACQELGIKPLVIHMDNPHKPVQLQTASYRAYKSAAEAQIGTHEDAAQLLKKGFRILRVRVEAMLNNCDSPKKDAEALKADPGNYFEFHARLDRVARDKFEEFQRLVGQFNLSDIGEHHKGKITTSYSTVGATDRYFVNSRGWRIGSETALTEWRKMLSVLKANGFEIAKEIPYEYTVYDQRPNLDNTITLAT